MFLMNTASFQLEEYHDERLPTGEYAILSHRWGSKDEEVTHHDLQYGTNVSYKEGFAKITNFCNRARELGYKYGWCDTCCINKDSTTELSTALNSMYRWYSQAGICLAYLADVHPDGRCLEESEWFGRGWTLQELIAPRHVAFYDRDWRQIGTKHDLTERLSQITSIPRAVLTHQVRPQRCSIAQRMSWAASRVTERVEDRAYSLLGLFEVTMQMVYGERENAFTRLQERIIQDSADQSIFVWHMNSHQREVGYCGLLPRSPDQFKECHNIVSVSENREYSLSNTGLLIRLNTIPYSLETYMAFLDCRPTHSLDERFATFAAKLPTKGQYARVLSRDGDDSASLIPIPNSIERPLRIRKVPAESPTCFNVVGGIRLRTSSTLEREWHFRVLSGSATARKDSMYPPAGSAGFAGIIQMSVTEGRSAMLRTNWIDVGFDDEFQAAIIVSTLADYTIDQYERMSFGRCSEKLYDIMREHMAVRSIESFDEALLNGPSSSAHSAQFAHDWSRHVRTENTSDTLVETRNRYSFVGAAIFDSNGNQESMPFAQLNGLPIKYRFLLLPHPSNDASEPSAERKLVWTLDLDMDHRSTSEESSPRYSLSRRARRIAPSLEVVGGISSDQNRSLEWAPRAESQASSIDSASVGSLLDLNDEQEYNDEEVDNGENERRD